MPVVTVRDAQPGDAGAIAQVWSTAVPYLVRSAARAAADLRNDDLLKRRRWVGLVDGQVAGTAAAWPLTGRGDAGEVFVAVEVRPHLGSRGVGTALLSAAEAAFPDATVLRAVSTDDPISMAFAVRNGFLPEGEQRITTVDTAVVAPAGRPPGGLRPVSLDTLPDLRVLLDAYNEVAADEPSGLSRPYSLEELGADWWDGPDNAPELSWGLLAESGPDPVLAAFATVDVDRERGRCWSRMTGTLPSHRGRGLGGWAKRRTLNALREAGLSAAWTAVDTSNAAMLAVDRRLGFETVATSVRLARRVPR